MERAHPSAADARPVCLLYASLHLSTYVVLDHFFALDSMLEDVTERRFVTAGFTAFVLMVPLALTSTQAMVRRLGGRRWQALHRLVYVSAGAGVVHYTWLVKADLRPPLAYGAVLLLLLGLRVWHRHRRITAVPAAPETS